MGLLPAGPWFPGLQVRTRAGHYPGSLWALPLPASLLALTHCMVGSYEQGHVPCREQGPAFRKTSGKLQTCLCLAASTSHL